MSLIFDMFFSTVLWNNKSVCYYVISEKGHSWEIMHRRPVRGLQEVWRATFCTFCCLVSKWTECVVTEEINPEDSRDDLTDPVSVLKKQVIHKWNVASRFWGGCDGCSHVWRTRTSTRISLFTSLLTQTLLLDWNGWIKLWWLLLHHSNASLVSALQ